MDYISSYYEWLGQKLNKNKSSILLSKDLRKKEQNKLKNLASLKLMIIVPNI